MYVLEADWFSSEFSSDEYANISDIRGARKCQSLQDTMKTKSIADLAQEGFNCYDRVNNYFRSISEFNDISRSSVRRMSSSLQTQMLCLSSSSSCEGGGMSEFFSKDMELDLTSPFNINNIFHEKDKDLGSDIFFTSPLSESTIDSQTNMKTVLTQRDFDEAKGRTTIMMRNIPNKYTKRMLLNVIEKEFYGTYDFYYLPIDFRNRCNVGYAFVNFVTTRNALFFMKRFNGIRLGAFRSKKICCMSWARIQGLYANIEHCRNSGVMAVPEEQYRPMVFRQGKELPFPKPNRPLPPFRLRERQARALVSMQPVKYCMNNSGFYLNPVSPLQGIRLKAELPLPSILADGVGVSISNEIHIDNHDKDILKSLFKATYDQQYVTLIPKPMGDCNKPLRIGVVLSGGQAPGGHNVIAGVHDYIKKINLNSQLIGFLNGPVGVYTGSYIEITSSYMDKFRNQGGFHMICSGRHKIETDEQKKASLDICEKLELHGLVVIGGDDSNTNAAILAEYFKQHNCKTCVIGVPKTIDGDLKNDYVEVSFGFDTATKVYSELIGNLTTDVATSQNRYHFVRLMGRSASNIALECALQTRPNLCFIGEEVQVTKRTLESLVDEIVDMVKLRYSMGKSYGIVLVPEGLIEFIPEIGNLIQEINEILAKGEFSINNLTVNSQKVFESLPKNIQQELLFERDPHGNVQVSKIATEKLLCLMAKTKLEIQSPDISQNFITSTHFFGYEGRCSMPSVFDCNYCYALGQTAGALIHNSITACMAIIRNLHLEVSKWKPAGCPIIQMMNVERRKGKDIPVIKKYLVDLQGTLFQSFKVARDTFKITDMYRNCGPIQYNGPSSNSTTFTISPPNMTYLLPPSPTEEHKSNFPKIAAQLSPLQLHRIKAPIEINPLLLSPHASIEETSKSIYEDRINTSCVSSSFPLQISLTKSLNCNVVEAKVHKIQECLRIGIVLCGCQAPGVNNVVLGLVNRMNLPLESGVPRGIVYGFYGIKGLLEGKCTEISKQDLLLMTNQGGFELLGRTESEKLIMRTPEGMNTVVNVCKNMQLDGLVVIGGQTTITDAALLTEQMLEYEQQHKESRKTCVIAVPANQENNIHHQSLETCLGFDSTSQAFSCLVGNLLTDAASATKYWYFVRIMCQTPSHVVLECALQTHPNMTVISEKYADDNSTLKDIVDDIADMVCKRALEGKNFGTVIVPDGLVHHLPQMRQLVVEVDKIVQNTSVEDFQKLEQDFVKFNEDSVIKQLTPWSAALLKSLPDFFRQQMVKRTPTGRVEFSELGTEELLSDLVGLELKHRKALGTYKGVFAPICHYLGFQVRSTLPTDFDCSLGLSNGYLAGILIERGLTGYMNSVRSLNGSPSSWKMTAIPITTLLKVMPSREMRAYGRMIPMVPCAEADLQGRVYAAYRGVCDNWVLQDLFSNPGPIQFEGLLKTRNRTLYEEHCHYLNLLKRLEDLTEIVKKQCSFGVDFSTIRTAVLSLEALVNIIQP